MSDDEAPRPWPETGILRERKKRKHMTLAYRCSHCGWLLETTNFDDWERVAVEKIKAETIEKCAQVAEGKLSGYSAAAAIRALKEKP